MKQKTLKQDFSRKYEIMFFLFISFEFITMITPPDKISQSITTQYLTTYEFGFAGHCLVGSFLTLFTKYITYKSIYIMAITSAVLLITLVSFLLGKVIRNSEDEIKNAMVIFTFLFLFSPFSITYLYGFHFSRFDTYWLMLTLLSIMVINKKYLRFLIPVFLAAAMLIHHGYISNYMPAVAIPLLYEMYKSKYKKDKVFLFALSCFTILLTFALCQFIKPDFDFATGKEFGEHLKKSTETVVSVGQINSEYFFEFKEWIVGIFRISESFALENLIPFCLCSFPFFIIFYYIWRYAYKNTEDKMMKFIIFLCMIAPGVFVISVMGAIDWDRWWASVMNTQFIIIFYLVYSKEDIIIAPLKKVVNYLKNHLLTLLLMAVFTNALTYSQILGLPLYTMDVDRFVDLFGNIDIR